MKYGTLKVYDENIVAADTQQEFDHYMADPTISPLVSALGDFPAGTVVRWDVSFTFGQKPEDYLRIRFVNHPGGHLRRAFIRLFMWCFGGFDVTFTKERADETEHAA